jgi:hypothetical protein
MGKNEQTPITVNGQEYILEDFDPKQRTFWNHIIDLDRKLNSARFNVDQLTIGREAFVELLAKSLEEDPEE